MIETSIIIPTFNRLAFLKEAVSSIFEQTHQKFEVLVVDDGSTDGTKEFIQNLDDRIAYLWQENLGPGAARNHGIREAQGKYVTFLDSDDLWLKDKLKVQIDFMESNPEALICYTDEIWIRCGRRVNPKKKHRKHGGWIFEHCLPLCIVSPSSVLMKAEFFHQVGVFDEGLPACEDYDLWLRASLKFPFHFIPQPLIVKRGGRPDQLSAQWGLDRYRVQALLKLLAQEDLRESQQSLVQEKVVEKCGILEQGFSKRGKKAETDTYRRLREKFTNESFLD